MLAVGGNLESSGEECPERLEPIASGWADTISVHYQLASWTVFVVKMRAMASQALSCGAH
jgi:hypothetical protein